MRAALGFSTDRGKQSCWILLGNNYTRGNKNRTFPSRRENISRYLHPQIKKGLTNPVKPFI
jgi:hypothetical protein